ncbi:hypothetical protein [Delftia lacustris]|nr:hypothetical protein [Delftia lacustris]
MTNIISITSSLDDAARANWNRYQYGKDRGHNDEYLPQAQRCEDMYMGQGKQWTLAARAQLEEERRPCYELNEIKPSINAALGYQIQNRADIAFKPRGGDADLNRATILSKVAMQVADMAGLHWHETQVFSDGVIQQRGYFDLRMNFDDNIKGEIAIGTLDPMDVIPDPDAKSYDPDDWSDVLVTRVAHAGRDRTAVREGGAAKSRAEPRRWRGLRGAGRRDRAQQVRQPQSPGRL